MTDDEITTFILRLHEKTLLGQVPWENTEAEDTFRALFSKYGVTVTKGTSYDPELGGEYTYYSISIVDLSGREVDSFTPFGSYMKHSQGERLFRETYEAARRKARGLDEALADLLVELGPGKPKEDDLEDEIPF